MIEYNTVIKAETATQAWESLADRMTALGKHNDAEDTRGGRVCAEIVNAHVVITDPTRGIVQSPLRNMSMRYALGELMWYLSGSNQTADIAQYGSSWWNLSDDGEHANSAYGYRIQHAYGFDQWEHCRAMLRGQENCRQAVIHIKDASKLRSKDVPCTIALQFLVRGDYLHMTTTMRSNDIWLGFPYDVFSFTAMQQKMAMELGVLVGTYTHNAMSLHMYERDYVKLEKRRKELAEEKEDCSADNICG